MNKTDYKGDTTGDGPSPIIWADCPVLEMQADPSIGFIVQDDFTNCPEHLADVATGKYDCYIDTGVTFKPIRGVGGGGIEVAGNDADNDEGVISGHAPAFAISDTAGSDKKLWFEAKVKKASIADNALGMFIGLAYDDGSDATLAQTLCLTDDDAALGAFSYIGFHVDQADGDAIDFVYKAEGQTAVVLIAGVQVPVADTYYKLGFVYDPLAVAAKKIAVYVDSVKQSTYVTATQIATATFPDGEFLAPVWCCKVGAAAESKAQMRFWRAAQLR